MTQGNEQLSRVFALLQDWLGVNGVSGRQNADSEHWHRYVCGISTLQAIVHVSLLLVCVLRADDIPMHLSPSSSVSFLSPNLMKSVMNGDIQSAATQEHVMLWSNSKQMAPSLKLCVNPRFSCRILRGLLEGVFGSFCGQQTEDASTSLSLQHQSLAFLSRLLQTAPVALQTLRSCNTWDRLYSSDMFFWQAKRNASETADTKAEATELKDVASESSLKVPKDVIKLQIEVKEQSEAIEVKLVIHGSRSDLRGRIFKILFFNLMAHVPLRKYSINLLSSIAI